MRFVLDTNVLVAAMRSQLGASHVLLTTLPLADWELVLSVPVYLEYRDVLNRPGLTRWLTSTDVVAVCRFLASIAHAQDIYFHWPSFLVDPRDDMLLELAVAAGASHIVTHNLSHFRGTESFGIAVVTPAEFLHIIGIRP